jgi:alpha-tubulin suppressor-like RCC1 family protein
MRTSGFGKLAKLGFVVALSLLFCAPIFAQSGGGFGWGDNTYGQLGNGHSNDLPGQALISGVTAIAGGDSHSLALKNDGMVWAWGYNAAGEPGNGTNTPSNVPVQVVTSLGGQGFAEDVVKRLLQDSSQALIAAVQDGRVAIPANFSKEEVIKAIEIGVSQHVL